MKKIFSAFLLMTMMVFSVGSFVSCSDLENELAQVEGTANNNAAAIEDLNSELAALKTALSAAQADADAAMAAAKAAKEAGDAAKAEAEAAKAAAEQAKAEAIAAAMAEIEAIQTAIAQNVEAITNLSGSVNANAVEIEALQEEIKALQTVAAEHVYAITNLNGAVEAHDMAIADLQTELAVLKTTLEKYEENLKELGLEDDALWTSISENLEAITNLQGRVDAQQMAIEDLMPAFEDVVAQVKTLNESLVVIYDILGALVNQIQSVVYVPDYRDDAATVFVSGINYTDKDGNAARSNLVAKLSFEVRPAKYAANITDENISFTSVETKAAKPQYFKGHVLETNPTTGRVEVAVIFEDVKGDKDDYDVLNNGRPVAVSLNIASVDVTELLIADSEPANIEMVSSNYANVGGLRTFSIKNAFCFYNANEEEYTPWLGNPNYENLRVPYNYEGTSAADQELFPDWEVMVCVYDADGNTNFFTPAEASELFGLDLTVKYTGKDENDKNVAPEYKKYGQALADTNEDKKVESPVAITGTGLDAVGTLVKSADYAGKDAIGVTGKLTLGQFKVGDVVLNLGGEATYEVVAGKINAAVVIDPIEKPWSYLDANTAWTGTTFAKVERNVKTDVVDNIVELFGDHNWGTSLRYSEKDEDGNTHYAYAYVYAASKNVVVVTDIRDNSGLLKYGTDKKTYTFTNEYVMDGESVNHTVAIDIVLGAMPAAKEITLDPVSIYTAPEMTKNVSVLDQVVKHIAAKDEKFELKSLEDDYVNAGTSKAAKLNGTQKDGVVELTLATGVKDKNIVDASVVEVTRDMLTKYENEITFVEEFEICGVKFTVNGTVNTLAPEFTFKVNPVTAPNGVAKASGKFELTKNAAGEVTGNSGFALNQIDLRNLVVVEFPEATGLSKDDYLLRYKLVTAAPTDEDGDVLASYVAPEFDVYSTLDNPTLSAAVNNLEWNCDWSTLKFEIALVANTADASEGDLNDEGEIDYENDIVFGDPVTVEIKIDELVDFAATENPVKVQYNNGGTTSANIVGGLTLTDVATKTALYNPYAKNLDEIFGGYYVDSKTGVGASLGQAYWSALEVYEQEVTAAADDKIEVYFNGEKLSDPHQVVPYVYEPATGEITLTATNIEKDEIKFVVPVALTHMYNDYGTHNHVANAVVIFTPEAVDNEADAVIPNPAGKQWNLGTDIMAMMYEDPTLEVDVLLDLGVTMKDQLFLASNLKQQGYPEEAIEQLGGEWMLFAGGINDLNVKATDSKSGVIEALDFSGRVVNSYEYYDYDGSSMKINVASMVYTWGYLEQNPGAEYYVVAKAMKDKASIVIQ